MANMLIPVEERNLTPDEVEALDKRRHRGLLLLILSTIWLIVSVVLLLWVGQDLTYSPGWARPMTYYFIITATLCIVSGLAGLVLRRSTPEF
jgi:hypothetical protein